MQRLLEEKNWSQRDLAKALGISETEVCRTLGLLDLHPEAQKALQEGIVTKGVAELLIPLDQETQGRVLPAILETAGERTGRPTVAKARRVIAEDALTEEEQRRKEDEAKARAMARALEERQTNHQSDEYDAWLDEDEPAQAVHLLYHIQQAAREVEVAVEAYSLNGCSEELREKIHTQAKRLEAVAQRVQEVTK